MPGRNRGRGSEQQSQGGNLSIQDFVFVGPRSSATISFRIVRGNRPVPNQVASFTLGKGSLKWKVGLVKGGVGPDANELWSIKTGDNGVGFASGVNLSGFPHKDYDKITITIDGCQPQTVDMDSEATTPTSPITAKPKRFSVSGEDVIKSMSDWFQTNLMTFQPDGKTLEPNKDIELESIETIIVVDRDTNTVLCNKQTRGIINTGLKGRRRLKIKLEGSDGEIIFTHEESLEEIKKKFQYEV